MMKQVVIVGLLLISFLFASTLSVNAADPSVTDATGDVCKMEDEICVEHVNRPDLDIYRISSTKSGTEVRLSLQLAEGGEIQSSEDYYYLIGLETTSNSYSVLYSGGEVLILDQDQNNVAEITHSGVGTRTFEISFNLPDGEECLNLSAITDYISLSGDEYSDSYPSLEIVVDISGPYSGYEDEPFHFSGTVEGSDSGYVWEWDFGDGNDTTGKNPTHTYSEPGTYDVILYVHDADETKIGVDTATITIKSKDDADANNDNKGSGLLPFILLIVVIVVAGIAVVVYVMRR